jgi:hypothetical protein
MRPSNTVPWPTHRDKTRRHKGWVRWANRERAKARRRGETLIIGREVDGSNLHVEHV